MRLLRLATFLEGGGAEASMRLYLKELSKDKKNNITLIYLSGTDKSKKELEDNGITVIRSSFSLRGLAQVIAYYLKFKPDIVHASLYKAEFFSLILKMFFGARVVVNRDVDFWSFRKSDFINKIADIIFHKYLLYPKVDKIIAISKHVREYLLNDLGFKSKKIKVVYYGIDFSEVEKYKRDKKNNNIVIGFVGRLVPQKGIDIFTDTLLSLPVFKNKKIIVNVYGVGPYDKLLQKLAPSLKKKGIFLVLKGFVHEIYKEYWSMDILFLPTQYEGFGLIFLEALSTKRVVILTSNIKPLDEVIGKHGVFCDKRDHMCFAKKLVEIIENPEKYAKRVYKGIESHLKKFSIKKTTRDLLREYKEILD